MIGYIEPSVAIESLDDLVNYDSIAEKLGIVAYVVQNKKYNDLTRTKTRVHHFSRCTLSLQSVNQIRKSLPKVRKKYDIVSIHTDNPKIAQWVAKDDRVDILTIPSKHQRSIIIHTLANVAAQNRTFFEIDLSDLLHTNYKLSVFLRNLTKVIHILLQKKAPFIFSLSVSSPYGFRDRRAVFSLANLLGVPEMVVKTHQKEFLQRLLLNRKKLSPNFIAPGIWLHDESQKKANLEFNDFYEQKSTFEDLSFSLKKPDISAKKLERQRYLLVNIISPNKLHLSKKDFEQIVWSRFEELVGAVGSSRIGFYVINYDEQKQTAIIRCSHLALQITRAILATISKINKQPVIIHVRRVSGTIKGLTKSSKKN